MSTHTTDDRRHRHFLHCAAEYTAHLRDVEFSIQGAPLIQQDMQVGVCAHAAIWMASRYMSSRFGDKTFSIAQINMLAKRTNTSGRLCPADYGLATAQILAALEGMGFAFGVYSAGNMDEIAGDSAPLAQSSLAVAANALASTRQLADIAYRYIESGLPVLLLTGNHVMVGIGHTLEENKLPQDKAGLLIERIPSFLIHNDSVGPYLELPLWEVRKDAQREVEQRPVFADVVEVVSIMPHEVTLCGEVAERIALTMVAQMPTFIAAFSPQPEVVMANLAQRPEVSHLWGDSLAGAPSHLLGRTFLLRSYEWLPHIRQLEEKHHYSSELTEYLMGIDYPRYVWVTEIMTSQSLAHPEFVAAGTTCLGFVVLDSTINSDANAAIVAHIGDVLVQFRNTVREQFVVADEVSGKIRQYPHTIYVKDSTPLPSKQMSWDSRRPSKHG